MIRLTKSAKIHRSANVCKSAIVGKQFRPLLDGMSYRVPQKTVLKEKVYVGCYSIVGAGSVIGAKTIIDDFSIVECEVKIGERNLLIYHTRVCSAVSIGDDCIIGGFVGENTIVGNNCRIFGKIVHSQYNPLLKWDGEDSEEEAPTLEDFTFIGFNAIIAGKVNIGYKAYIMAGAIVTKDVPARHIASGINNFIHFTKWPGKLSQSPFFRG